jgi:hypothetical protein
MDYNTIRIENTALFAHANPCWFQQLTERLRTVERNVIFFSLVHADIMPFSLL